jgi:hypothetical protein
MDMEIISLLLDLITDISCVSVAGFHWNLIGKLALDSNKYPNHAGYPKE